MLLFPYGTDGFQPDISKDGKAKSVMVMEYYCWQLICSATAGPEPLNVVLCGDRLFLQQANVVDACAKMEQQQLNLRFNQNSVRS